MTPTSRTVARPKTPYEFSHYFYCQLINTNNFCFLDHSIYLSADGVILKNGRVINTTCWVTRTFTPPNQTIATLTHSTQTGALSYVNNVGDVHYYLSYYLIIHFLQVIMLYLPHLCWTIWEKGTIAAIRSGLRTGNTRNKTDMTNRLKMLVTYLCESINSPRMYALYLLCEVSV